MFGSGGLEKGLGLGLNPSIDSAAAATVDGMSDLCTSVMSARQVETHTDMRGC